MWSKWEVRGVGGGGASGSASARAREGAHSQAVSSAVGVAAGGSSESGASRSMPSMPSSPAASLSRWDRLLGGRIPAGLRLLPATMGRADFGDGAATGFCRGLP